jgi:hypothetical protein
MEGSKMKPEPGMMINLSRHEDDDPFIALRPLEALIVAGGKTADAFKVIIPLLDPDRTFFIHRPEKVTV